MKKMSYILTGLALLLLAVPAGASPHFDFTATLRVDLHHVGDAKSERFMIDELRREGAWPGRRTLLVDDTGNGVTLAQVYSVSKKPQLLFSTSYCTMFGEWRTTGEAKKAHRVHSETVRMPMPKQKVLLIMSTRNRKGKMVKVFQATLDPAVVAVSRERRRGERSLFSVVELPAAAVVALRRHVLRAVIQSLIFAT